MELFHFTRSLVYIKCSILNDITKPVNNIGYRRLKQQPESIKHPVVIKIVWLYFIFSATLPLPLT